MCVLTGKRDGNRFQVGQRLADALAIFGREYLSRAQDEIIKVAHHVASALEQLSQGRAARDDNRVLAIFADKQQAFGGAARYLNQPHPGNTRYRTYRLGILLDLKQAFYPATCTDLARVVSVQIVSPHNPPS